MRDLKIFSVVVGLCVAGIVFSFGMSVYTAARMSKEKHEPAPLSIPIPALPQ